MASWGSYVFELCRINANQGLTAEIDWNYTSWSRRCRKILIGLVVRGAKTVVVRGKNRILTRNRKKPEMTVPISQLYGYHGGPKIELDMEPNSDRFTLNLATLFEMRANRYDISWLKAGTSAETFIYYLYVPMDLMYKKTIAKNTKWLLYGGPRLNIGLFGFTNKHYYLATTTQEKYTKPFGSDGSLSPMDYSAGIGTGIELGHFQFMFGYDFPLSNSSKDPDLSQVRQHNFRASVAYSFRKLKQ